MLQLNQLTITHRKDLSILFDKLSLTINTGDKIALIGEEGTGKTTLLHVIRGDESIHHYLDIEGSIINQFNRVGYLPQGLSEALLSESIHEFFFYTLDPTDLDYNLMYQLASQLQLDVDLIYSDRSLDSLSGGERIKIQLLQILLQSPDLLLLDEPSNDLDMASLDWLAQFISQTPLTVIFISHDESLLEQTATAILHLERLQHKRQPKATFKRLAYANYLSQRQADYHNQETLALTQRKDHEKTMERHRQVRQKVAYQLENTRNDFVGQLLKKKMHTLKSAEKRYERQADEFADIPEEEEAIAIHFNQSHPIPTQQPIFHLYDYALCLNGEVLSHPIHLTVRSMDKIAITGNNGVGKTTLLRQLKALLSLKPQVKLGYMPQNYQECMDFSLTPLAFLVQNGDKEEKERIQTYLASLRLTIDEMTHPIASLSGGQQAKVLLAKFDLEGVNTLLLDEPTRNFSPSSQGKLRDLFSQFPGCIITVSHDRKFITEVATLTYELTPHGLVEITLD